MGDLLRIIIMYIFLYGVIMMRKTYVYMDHSEFNFYLSDRLRTEEELYCPVCKDSDYLIGIYESKKALAAKLEALFREGYDLMPCDEYNELKDEYCPPELRAGEKECE